MGRGPSSAKLAEWRRRLRGFRPALETVAEFCDREGVSVASFYHWRRVLKTAASSRSTAAVGAAGNETARGAAAREAIPAMSFVSVEIDPPAASPARVPESIPPISDAASEAASADRIEVLLPNGVRLLVPCDAPAAIRTVVAALADGA